MNKKLYFTENDGEYCYPAKYYDEGDILFLAVPDKDKEYFFCRAVEEVGTSDTPCGKECSDYDPKNGRTGMCRHKGFCYTSSGEKFIKKGNRAVRVVK